MKKFLTTIAIIGMLILGVYRANADNLYNYFNGNLPTISNRAAVFAEFSSDKYVGSESQNIDLLAYLDSKKLGARTDNSWNYGPSGTYIFPLNSENVLMKGVNRYFNFNSTSGVNGYGVRDNSGAMEYKNSGGSWAGIGSGGGGGTGTTTWGTIIGTLSSQTDLQSALDAKLSTSTAASTYYLQTNPSSYITSSALVPYLSTSTAASTYQPLGSYISTTTGNWLGTWQSNSPTDFLASSTTYLANNLGNWAGTFQNKNASDFLASSTATNYATVALSNLANVGINTSLISDTNSTDNLGSSTIRWANTYTDKVYIGQAGTTSGAANAGAGLVIETAGTSDAGISILGSSNRRVGVYFTDSSNTALYKITADFNNQQMDFNVEGFTLFSIYYNNNSPYFSFKGNLKPTADNSYDLGASNIHWLTTYTRYINLDTGASLSTEGAGVVGITGDIKTLGTAPVLSSCGTSPSIRGTDTAGEITVGSVAATGCVMTFNTATAYAPSCVVTNQSSSVINALTYTISTTTLTIAQTGLTSNVLDYHCIVLSN